jgi:hypothetical protein
MMPKVRDILVHVRVERAERQRKCRRGAGNFISKGEMCMVVKTNPTNDDYSYGVEPAKAMLDSAWIKLKSLYTALGLTPPP